MEMIPHLAQLSDQDRKVLRARLEAFEQGWSEDSLVVQARQLSATDPLRLPALIEMIKVDLRQRWQRGQVAALEMYLKDYPELGAADTVPADLVRAEYETRRAHGDTPSPDDFRRRFPRQAALVLGPGGAPDLTWTAPPGAATRDTSFPPPPLVPPNPSSMAARELPEQFGRYRVEKKLGQGGMGAVYLAHDTQLDRPVALKVPSPRLAAQPGGRERFYREARAASAFNHPNLCPVYDVGETEGVLYLTMPYVEGRPLSDLIQKGEPLPQRQVAALVCKLARAMQEAHSRGVIHRDLKPSNIVITPTHEPVIMDFGLARRDSGTDARLTSAGQVMGTPAYMPPEQVRGDVAAMGPGCDVYSLGVILYELLTGRLPFLGPVGEVLGQVLGSEPPPPSAHRPDLDPVLEAICLKAMAKKVEDRYASMATLAAALAAYLEGAPQPRSEAVARPMPAGAPARAEEAPGLTSQLVTELLARLDQRPRRALPGWAWALGAAVVLLLLAGVGYLVFRPTPPPQQVSVRLGDVTINTTLVYVLNGERINPQSLQGEVDLPVGENRLVIKRGNEVIEERVFQVGRDQAGETVPVPPARDAEEVQVERLAGLRVDPESEKDLTFWLDGESKSLAELRQTRTVRRGVHTLVVKQGERVLGTQVFAVGLSDQAKPIPVDLDYRRVAVNLQLPNVDLGDAQLRVRLDQREVSLEELRKPLRLLPGRHDLVVVRGGAQTQDRFDVPQGGGAVEVRLLVAAPRPRAEAASSRPLDTAPAADLPATARAFLQALEDEDVSVRVTAAARLVEFKHRAVIAALGKALGDKSGEVRREAADSLGTIGDRSAAEALVKRIADDTWHPFPSGFFQYDPKNPPPYDGRRKGWGSKDHALTALERVAPDRVVSALAGALKAKPPEVRRWAVAGLSARKGEAVASALVAALSDADGQVRRAAADGLAKLGDRSPATLEALVKRVKDDTWLPRPGGFIYYDRDDPPAYDDHQDWGSKHHALAALRKLAPDRVEGALLDAMKATNPKVRAWAVREQSSGKRPR